jgi:hypothetical protein
MSSEDLIIDKLNGVKWYIAKYRINGKYHLISATSTSKFVHLTGRDTVLDDPFLLCKNERIAKAYNLNKMSPSAPAYGFTAHNFCKKCITNIRNDVESRFGFLLRDEIEVDSNDNILMEYYYIKRKEE